MRSLLKGGLTTPPPPPQRGYAQNHCLKCELNKLVFVVISYFVQSHFVKSAASGPVQLKFTSVEFMNSDIPVKKEQGHSFQGWVEEYFHKQSGYWVGMHWSQKALLSPTWQGSLAIYCSINSPGHFIIQALPIGDRTDQPISSVESIFLSTQAFSFGSLLISVCPFMVLCFFANIWFSYRPRRLLWVGLES